MNDGIILSARHLCKTFPTAGITAIYDVNLTLKRGKTYAIVGKSGSGKSTLLYLLAGLDRATQGEVLLLEENFNLLSERKKALLRNQKLGFIYQFHHLLPEFSALENVGMPLRIAGFSSRIVKKRAEEMLAAVELSTRMSHRPAELSGGERQRVAVARALIHEPICVLADEPTGNLDSQTAEKVFALILELAQQKKITFVIATHDEKIAQHCDHILQLRDGVLFP